MSDLNINDPVGNQILVFNEITGKFENTTLTADLIQNFNYVSDAMNLSNEAQIYNDNIDGTLRFRGIVGTGGITATNFGSNVRISFDGDATTLSGLGRGGFLQVSNNLNDVNPTQARNNLNVLSSSESYDLFMEANASNIPDIDNTYDMGSNGRRFANMFAVTFHGNATSASIADTLQRNGASDGQVLVWRNSENTWVPETPVSNTLTGLTDVDPTNLQHESVIVYNGVRNKFEMVPSSYFAGSGGSGGGSGLTAESIGTGQPVYSTTLGSVMRFRSLKSGNNINITTDVLGEELIINATTPTSTSDLPEGSNRYYKRDYFLGDMNTISIQQLANVDKLTSPTNGQAPVWDGTKWAWRTVSVNLTNTDSLVEGTSNLYFNTTRANTAIQNYVAAGNINLNNIGDVNVPTPLDGSYLYFDIIDNTWKSRKVSIHELQGVNTTGVLDNQTLVWSSATNRFNAVDLPVRLEQLQSTPQSMAFNQQSFDGMFVNKTTEDLPEHPSYKYLNLNNLQSEITNISIGELSDVDIAGVSNGNILIWDSSISSFKPADSADLNINVNMGLGDLNNVNESSIITVSNGDTLVYESASQQFVMGVPRINVEELNNTNIQAIDNNQTIVWNGSEYVNRYVANSITPPSNNDVLVYNTLLQGYVSQNINSLSASIFNIAGTTYDSLDNNDILVYNSVTEHFENKKVTTSIIEDIDGTTKQDGYVLTYNADNDNHVYTVLPTSIKTLYDTDIDNIQELQSIVWNGTSMVPANVVTFDTASENDLLQFVGNAFVNRTLKQTLGITSATVNEILRVSTNGISTSNGIQLNEISNLELPTTPVHENNYNLQFNAIYNRYILSEVSSSTTIQLSEIGDLVLPSSGVFDGAQYVLEYDASNNTYKMENVELNLDDISNVSVVTLPSNDAQMIFNYNVGNSTFELQELVIPDPIMKIVDMEDFQHDFIVEPTPNNKVLTYLNGDFVLNEIVVPPTVNATTDLSDVSDVQPAHGQVLVYNSVTSQYEPQDQTANSGSSNGGIYERNSAPNQTIFNIEHEGNVWVWANGILLPSSEVILTDYNVVELVTPRNLNDHLRFMVIVDSNTTQPTVSSLNGVPFEFISIAGQTEFILDHNHIVMVFANGILLNSSQYDADSDNTKIILNTARNVGDVVRILVLNT